jgi:hypothetical protein
MCAQGGGQGLLAPSGILLPAPPLLLLPFPYSYLCPRPLLLLLCKLLLLLMSLLLPLLLGIPPLLDTDGAATALATMLGRAAAMLSAATLLEGRTGRSKLPGDGSAGAPNRVEGGADGENNSRDLLLLLLLPLLLA